MSAFREFASLGQGAYARGDMAEAERLFREALVHKPGSPGATRGLGMALVNQEKFAEAEAVWQRMTEIEPQSAENQRVLGSIYLTQRKLALAVKHFKRALEIRPDMPGVAMSLAQVSYVNREYAAAMDYYKLAHARDPFDIDALKGAVQLLMDCRRESEAVAVATAGLERLRMRDDIPRKDYAGVYMILADVYKALGDLARVQDCYRTVIADDPAHEVALHYLAGAEGRVTHDHAQAFARDMFDGMAAGFDKRLVGLLGYRSPTLLAQGLRDMNAGAGGFKRVLDLGCGTGLMAAALKELFKVAYAVGVDLSPNMVREAEKRGVYDELICGDVVDTMAAREDAFDLIVAADVFIYVGELSKVFALAKVRLTPGGVFAFTTEIGVNDVELAAQGHYRHSKAYIARLAVENGFAAAQTHDAPIRQERSVDVMGHYVYLRA